MITLISETKYDRIVGFASLTISYDNLPVIQFIYNKTTGLVMSPEIESPFTISFDNAKETLNDISNWLQGCISAFGKPQDTFLVLQKIEYEVKTNEISTQAKDANNNIILAVEFLLPQKEITVKPRIALEMPYSDFNFWLKALIDFYGLIKRRGY